MKSKFLKLNKPCSERWEHMKPNAKGSFCETCAKNVIDFTKLSQAEISEKMKNSKGEICARVTKTQLETPLLDVALKKQYKLPYSNFAASVLLASTLAVSTSACAQQQQEKTATEFVQSNTLSSTSKIKRNYSKLQKNTADPFVTFKGKIIDQQGKTPIAGAKVMFVTIQKMFVAYSGKDGTFSMEIPAEFVDDANVVRISYNGIYPEKGEQPLATFYETTDHILSKKEATTHYTVQAEQEVVYLGGIGRYRSGEKPLVLDRGKKIDYLEFQKAAIGEKSSCSMENKEYHFFTSKMAVAIYGEEAKDGLYILVDSPKK